MVELRSANREDKAGVKKFFSSIRLDDIPHINNVDLLSPKIEVEGVYLALDQGKVCGIMKYSVLVDRNLGPYYHVEYLIVSPTMRGRGIGSSMLHMLTSNRSVLLETLRDNKSMNHLLQKEGFKLYNRNKRDRFYVWVYKHN